MRKGGEREREDGGCERGFSRDCSETETETKTERKEIVLPAEMRDH